MITTEAEPEKRTQVRFPATIHQWLTDRAKLNDRSMNAELIRILKEKKEESDKQQQVA